MALTPIQVHPDVENIVVVHRNGDGVPHEASDWDLGMNKKRAKSTKVIVVQPGGEKVSSGGMGSKKGSKHLRPMEKKARKSVTRTINILEDYLYLHDQANMKKKNGWLGAYTKNLRKAIKRNM